MIDHIQCLTDSLIMLLLQSDLHCLHHGNEIIAFCRMEGKHLKTHAGVQTKNFIIIIFIYLCIYFCNHDTDVMGVMQIWSGRQVNQIVQIWHKDTAYSH